MADTRKQVDSRVMFGLLLLNLAVHFVPFERPGFQPDDFHFLHNARVEPAWSFVEISMAQATRPLGFLLYILTPKMLGLHQPGQLAVLVVTTSLLTGLVYVQLVGALPRNVANLAALAFVVWPVKHEIYASQFLGVINLAGALIVGSALLYKRWARTSSAASLGLAVICYGLSIFTYEIGYLAPLVFYLVGRAERPRPYGVALFLVPAGLYWVFRLTHGTVPIGGGLYPLSLKLLAWNLLTSLPSNLAGFQVARNTGYGLWGVISGPIWFQVWCGVTALVVGGLAKRWIGEAQRPPQAGAQWGIQAASGLMSAALLALPAAMVLVESRHSVLAAIGMGVVVAALAARLRTPLGLVTLLTLMLATQGLALRQAEASRLQASVHELIMQRGEEIRAASVVVVDIASLARRVRYTWGERNTNALRSYWGIDAFGAWGFEYMVEDAIYEGKTPRRPAVRSCSGELVITESSVMCDRDYANQAPFKVARLGTLIIDFKTMTLP